jgi:methylglutaconyl-CoA hydratase
MPSTTGRNVATRPAATPGMTAKPTVNTNKRYETLSVTTDGEVMTVALNRPELRNAFNDRLIEEGIELFEALARDAEGVRVVVLRGEGKVFCAGADLNWMSRMVSYSREENVADSSRLARLFAVMNELPVPLVGRIHGAAIGGGVGLVAVCDVAVAAADAVFGLSEVKLGILPAVISPYVIAKIGETHARALFLTGERFGAERAQRIGLVHAVAASESEIDEEVNRLTAELSSSGPEAVRACKKLVFEVARCDIEDAVSRTIDAIAERRVSSEGQQGMQAFLRKEKAPWVK